MPNLVYNRIVFCDEKLIDKIWDDEKVAVDFGILIPEPETREECIEKYGDKYIDHGDHHLGHEDGKEWFNWYDWNCDFWGTKWNAFEGEICFKGNGEIVISFTTAWAPPDPWIKALSKFGVAFTHHWIHEFSPYEEVQAYNCYCV